MNIAHQKAPWGKRLLATIIDQLFFMVILSPILIMFFEPKEYSEAEIKSILQTQGILGLIDPVQTLFAQSLLLIITVTLWVKFAGTPGKRLLNLRVVDAKTGKNLTPTQSALRYVGYFISSFPLCLGFFWALFDENNQTWHDKIAGTLVIQDDSKQIGDKSPQRIQPKSKSDDDNFVA